MLEREAQSTRLGRSEFSFEPYSCPLWVQQKPNFLTTLQLRPSFCSLLGQHVILRTAVLGNLGSLNPPATSWELISALPVWRWEILSSLSPTHPPLQPLHCLGPAVIFITARRAWVLSHAHDITRGAGTTQNCASPSSPNLEYKV